MLRHPSGRIIKVEIAHNVYELNFTEAHILQKILNEQIFSLECSTSVDDAFDDWHKSLEDQGAFKNLSPREALRHAFSAGMGWQAHITYENSKNVASLLGRKGGQTTSAAKTAANRAKSNLPPGPGKKPRGRPKKEIST